MRRKKNKETKEQVKAIFLGGLEQIGMNITAFEYEDSIVVVDCGMAFPDEDLPGVDLIIPDTTYLQENASKVKGFFITHGHEDHIGALPYVLKELNVPVYGTKLAIALIRNKLIEKEMLDSAKLNEVSFGDKIDAGAFQVEFIKTNHSIQDAASLAIHTPAGVILYTGDFKVDYTPVFGDPIDLHRLAELGSEGVLALMCDSTNALRQGFTMSERVVGRTLEGIFLKNMEKRIIIASFASNVDRVQQVITLAEKYGRKVCIDGRSMINVITTAVDLGYIKVEKGTLIDSNQINNYPPEKLVLITTGSQGESMAALSRMATGQHKKIVITASDTVILSSTPIPGNEKAVARVINELCRKQALVIYQDTHVSGHACQEEIKLIYSILHPRFSIPIHGEYRHRLEQKRIAMQVGMADENVLLADTGDVVAVSKDNLAIVDHVQSGPIMVDGLGVGDVGNCVIRDRMALAKGGILTVTAVVDREKKCLISGPEISTHGFVYAKESEELLEDIRNVARETLENTLQGKRCNSIIIRSKLRDELSDYIWRRMKRSPVVDPLIMETSYES